MPSNFLDDLRRMLYQAIMEHFPRLLSAVFENPGHTVTSSFRYLIPATTTEARVKNEDLFNAIAPNFFEIEVNHQSEWLFWFWRF